MLNFRAFLHLDMAKAAGDTDATIEYIRGLDGQLLLRL
jgi:hypothetical protein